MKEKISKRDENKIKRRESIIDTAEKIFLEKDFESTSMDEISIEAKVTKRTLYKYFISKEDLFFAVAVKGAKRYISVSKDAIQYGKNALEKFREVNKAYCQFYLDNPGMFRLMNYQPDNMLNCEASPNYRELGELKNRGIKNFMIIFEEGKKDGSINKNLDTKKTVYFGLFSSMGLLNLVSTMNKDFFWKGENIDEKEFLFFSMNLLADALK